VPAAVDAHALAHPRAPANDLDMLGLAARAVLVCLVGRQGGQLMALLTKTASHPAAPDARRPRRGPLPADPPVALPDIHPTRSRARGQRASRLRPYRSERAPSKWLPAPETALVGPTAAGRPVGIGPERPRPSSRYGGSTKAGVTKPSSAGLGLRGSGASATAQPEGLAVRAMNRRSHAPSADLYLHSTVGDTDVT